MYKRQHRVRSIGIRDRPTSPRSPWQNAYAERLIGSIRRECIDDIVGFGERHLRHVLLSYMTYYDGTRTQCRCTRRRDSRTHALSCDPGRTASSIYPDLICRRLGAPRAARDSANTRIGRHRAGTEVDENESPCLNKTRRQGRPPAGLWSETAAHPKGLNQ